MSESLFEADDAATPLTPEERDGLIPAYITTRRELNEAEHLGIQAATAWAFARKRDVLNEPFLKRLHREMFKSVWSWAGQYRQTERNIGIEAWRIAQDVAQLVDDTRYWIEHTTYGPDEIAVRFHHRLVSIHPFPNGNGRHARLAADLLITQLGGPRFTWGRSVIAQPGDVRSGYIHALRTADRHDIAPLLAFVRS